MEAENFNVDEYMFRLKQSSKVMNMDMIVAAISTHMSSQIVAQLDARLLALFEAHGKRLSVRFETIWACMSDKLAALESSRECRWRVYQPR